MSRTPSRSATISAALAAALLVAACSPAPSTSPGSSPTPPASAPPSAVPGSPQASQSAEAIYGTVQGQVEQIRGLQPTAAVAPVIIDTAQLTKNLTEEFDTSNPPAQIKVAEQLLIGLGLLPAGASLRALTLDLQAGQVIGYYSPEKKELFVVQRSGGGIGPLERVTYSHEFTHQLQDQHFDLHALGLDAPDQSDRSLGRLALVEGDAVSVQQTWMQSELSPQELGQVLAASLDPAALAALQRAPAYLRQISEFPYTSGLLFVTSLLAQGGYDAVDAAFKSPPDSTEQILHPEKYASHEKPDAVAIPDGLAARLGAGWSVAGRDTLGELVLRIWLQQGGATGAVAATAAAGWGGDRVVLLRGPDGAVSVGLISSWDTAADAAEFVAAAAAAAKQLDPGAVVVSDGLRRVIVAMGGRTADVAAALAK